VAPAEVVQVSEAHELEPHHTHPHTGPCSPHSAPQNTTHTHTHCTTSHPHRNPYQHTPLTQKKCS
jgi:hypothetical protein